MPAPVAGRARGALVSIAAVTGALFVGATALVVAAPSVPLDASIADWSAAGSTPWLLDAAAVVRFLASYAPFALIFAVGAVLWARRRRSVALLLMGNFVVSMAVSVAIKILVNRSRPDNADEASFPSSSVVSCIAFWGLVSALLIVSGDWRQRWWQRAMLALSAVLIVLVGPARLYVGDHWFSDVVAGYLLGAATVSMSLWIYLRHRTG